MRPRLRDYRFFVPYNSRWIDNDMYFHFNNAIYTTYIDGAVNAYLQWHCGISATSGKTPIGLVINSHLSYAAQLEYPNPLLAAIRVDKLGSSSVTYGVALFKAENTPSKGSFSAQEAAELSVKVDPEAEAACHGQFTHVFVDPKTRKKVAMSPELKQALQRIAVDQGPPRAKL